MDPDGLAADCDDVVAAINPDADEVCDDDDNDCDGVTDEDDAIDAPTWYLYDDGDGFGELSMPRRACGRPDGHVADNTDCDDDDELINPDADERCNLLDDDCDERIDNGVLGSGAACPAESCAEILALDESDGDGTYFLTGATAGVYQTHCDMTRDGGGWTFVGSLVNAGTRRWNSYLAWTGTSTFGTLADRRTAGTRVPSMFEVDAQDILIVTNEYAFAFFDLLGDTDFAAFLTAEYDPTDCSIEFLASGADWSEVLTAEQAAAQSFVVRPLDNNAWCFPDTNENAFIGIQFPTCCWTGGLGNTPGGQAQWRTHDLSLLQLSRLTPLRCAPAGEYPCNRNGYWFHYDSFCYDASCKVPWAEMYVR